MDPRSLPSDRARLWTDGVPVEPEAVKQIANVTRLPILAGPVAVMPDVHLGKGATVGTVIATRGAIIPAAVGVDIGCGMCAIRTTLRAGDLPDSLESLRSAIEARVPVGFAAHDAPQSTHDDGLVGIALHRRMKALRERFATLAIAERVKVKDASRIWKQVGTLGGGNHFIEVCLDESDAVWIMLHSGSRNIGKEIGEAAIGEAREAALAANRRLPDRDLAWLDEGTQAFDDYVAGLRWAQDYAALNRDMMMHLVVEAVEDALGRPVTTTAQAVNCHHNYAALEEHFGERVWVTRKGAVSARAGELGIIPGSMGARSYITRGLGNPLSYCSCSHGAGRRMSRSEAKRRFDRTDLAAATEGIACRKDDGVVDEIPAAYKDIDAVMAAQRDLVEVAHTLRQVVCVKG
jgi:tRNA-splicing ligase RtcB